MKIKILKSCSGKSFSFKQGDEPEVEERIGDDLIKCGFATNIAAKTETAATTHQTAQDAPKAETTKTTKAKGKTPSTARKKAVSGNA